MGILSKLFGKRSGPTPVERVPLLTPLVQAMATDPRVMWPSFYESLRGRWDLRLDAIDALVDLYILKQPAAARRSMSDDLAAADPTSWLIVRSSLHLAEAWQARGAGRKIKDAAGFERGLAQARTDAERVLARDPTDPAAYALLLKIARGLDDSGLRDAAYAHVSTHAPDCFACHLAYNTSLSARWGGNHDLELAHARRVAAQASDGQLAAALPIHALYFQVSHLSLFDKDDRAAKALAAHPAVLDEVRRATARSVDDPRHVVSTATFDLRTKAAVIGWQGNDAEITRQQLAGLGDVFIKDTWNQLTPDPEEWFSTLRRMYGLG